MVSMKSDSKGSYLVAGPVPLVSYVIPRYTVQVLHLMDCEGLYLGDRAIALFVATIPNLSEPGNI